MKKIISITGSSSFLAKDVINNLKKNYILKLSYRNQKKNTFKQADIKIFKGSLENKSFVNQFLNESDFLINIAFDPLNLEKNIKIVDNLIKVSNKNKNLKRFIHLSTAAVIGKNYDDEIDEKSKCFPLNKYQKIKLFIEKKLTKELSNNIDLVILRPTEIADYRNLSSTIFNFKKKCFKNFLNSLYKFLFGSRILNFVSIENVSNSIVFFIKKKIVFKFSKKNIFFISEDKKKNNFTFFYNFFNKKKNVEIRKYSELKKNIIKLLFFYILKKPNPFHLYSNKKIKKIGFKFKFNVKNHLNKIKHV